MVLNAVTWISPETFEWFPIRYSMVIKQIILRLTTQASVFYRPRKCDRYLQYMPKIRHITVFYSSGSL